MRLTELLIITFPLQLRATVKPYIDRCKIYL